MIFIKATPNPIFVDSTGAGSATIEYGDTQSIRLMLYQQFAHGGWTRVPLSGQAEYAGQFPITLSAGELYQAKVFKWSRNDPNVDEFKQPLAELAVVALSRPGAPGTLISDGNEHVGGTFCAKSVVTTTPTICLVEVAREAPAVDSRGVLEFRNADASVSNFDSFVAYHRLPQLVPLLPGTQYHCLVRVSDQNGVWEQKLSQFNTLPRKVTVDFTELHILNDGDDDTILVPHDQGDFLLHFEVLEGSTVVRQFYIPEDTKQRTGFLDDSPDGRYPLNQFPQLKTHVIGPKQVPQDKYEVRIRIHGLEDDDMGDEEAANNLKGEPLQFPVGEGAEEVLNRTQWFSATPSNADSTVRFAVAVKYSATYQ